MSDLRLWFSDNGKYDKYGVGITSTVHMGVGNDRAYEDGSGGDDEEAGDESNVDS